MQQRSLIEEAKKIAHKAQSLPKKKTTAVEALAGDGQEEAEHDREQQPDERSESGSAAATPSSPSPQQDEDETHHTESDNEQENGEEDSRAQVSQARLSQTRRISPRKSANTSRMVVVKETKSKNLKRKQAEETDDDAPLVLKPKKVRKGLASAKSKQSHDDGSSADDAPFGPPSAPDGTCQSIQCHVQSYS